MNLNELTTPEAPVELTPAQLAKAQALAKALATGTFPAEPTLAEGAEDEFIEV